MLRRPRLQIYISELLIVSANFFLVYCILQHFKMFYRWNLIPFDEVVKGPNAFNFYVTVFWTIIPFWGILLWWRRGQQSLRVQSYRAAAQNLALTGIIFSLFFLSVSFLLKFNFLSRMFILVYAISSTGWLIVNRLIILHCMKEAKKRGEDVRHILLAGTGRRAQEFISDIAKHVEWGYQLVGLLDRNPEMTGAKVAGYPVLGVLEDLPEILETQIVDEIVFVAPRSWMEDVRKCVLYCEAVGIPATISTDLFDLEIALGAPKKLEGKTYLTVETRVPKGWELFVKRIFDVVGSSLILLLASPVLLAVAWAIKLNSPGPIFFRQIRCSRNGRRFVLYKFRSMVMDAEAKLAALKSQNEMTGPVFKITHDPRITAVGRFLRKTSLDEFPQFWNVLKGDMSLVGPRPALPSEVTEYEPWQRRRLSLKPGITCIWQATHRDGANFEEWMDMDLRYIDNWSLWLDSKILFLTGRAVFVGSGK